MKVILKQDVKSLGKKDSVVTVSDGYAKNYLLPKGLAVEATTGNMNEAKNKQQAAETKKQREIDAAKASAAALNGKTVTIHAKAGENGKLFGAIASKDIADAAASQLGVALDKKKIVLSDPLKTTGAHTIEAKIYSGVTAEFTVMIVAG